MRINLIDVDGTTGQQSELDSHADTCVVGNDTALITHDFERPVRVLGYNESAGKPITAKTVTAVVAYDHPETGEIYMLIIHQAILVNAMKHNLLSPMQLRDNGLRVNDEPKHMVLTPTDYHHAISIPTGDDGDPMIIPLSLSGVTSYFPTRKPTRQEWENTDLSLCIELTAEDPEWDPHTNRFSEQEATMLDSNGRLRDRPLKSARANTIAALHSIPQDTVPDCDFGHALIWTKRTQTTITAQNKNKACIRLKSIQAVKSSKRSYPVTSLMLAKRWGISTKLAEKTIDATTQRTVRSILHPTLSRRFRTNDRQLRYRRLYHDMYTDTLQARVTSWFRQNRYAQVFATRFGWVQIYPMKQKSDAHEGLSLLAQRDGVPPKIIMDGSKEQTMGEFRKKAKQMGTHIVQTEPRSPWQNAAEGAIRETKRGSGRKMTKSGAPAKLWDHCLELEGYIRSHTALDIYELEGQVPETIVSGQTADISPFVECAWYEWVFWWDSQAKLPEPREVLGRWLGPALDIGPAMTSKILKQNGEVIYLSTYRPLTEDEKNDAEIQRKMKDFDDNIRRKLGAPISTKELSAIDGDIPTPEHEYYEDDFEGTPNVPDADEVTPEDLDNYVGAQVNLPYQGSMMAGKVIKRARDNEGNPVGTKNDNPILDTRSYQVEFPDGNIAEYSANIIAENMFAMCDPEGNQHLLLEAIIDHKRDNSAVKFADRFIIVNGRQHHRKTTVGWKLCIRMEGWLNFLGTTC